MRRFERTFGVSVLCLLCFSLGCGGTETLTVGGTISGLNGTLILQLNGGNDLTLTENGPYVFDITLEKASTYAVTIQARPSNQNCSVINATGTVVDTDIANADVICADKAWTHPTNTADAINPEGSAAFNVQVAMSDNGDAVVVWPQNNGTHLQIFVSEYRNGVWTHPRDLNDNISPDGFDARRVHVAMGDDGQTIVAWSQMTAASWQIFFSQYLNGAWTHPSGIDDFISPATGGDATWPKVAMDGMGNALIVWQQGIAGNSRILVSQYREGRWIHPSSTSQHVDPRDGYSRNPFPVMNDLGEALVVWQQDVGTHFQIFKSEFRDELWLYPLSSTDDISPDGSNTHGPRAAIDNEGNAIVVWEQSDGERVQVFKSEYRNGGWIHPVDLTDNISLDGEHCGYPQVAMSDAGTALIVWEQEHEGQEQAFVSEYREGAWTHPASFDDHISPNGAYQYLDEARVAMDAHGNAIVAWFQEIGPDPAPYQVFMSEYRRESWTHPERLQDYISFFGTDGTYPEVAMDNNGDAIVVWYDEVGGETQIFVSEYR